MKFSFALIAKNEEKTLPRLIGSLKEFQERGGEILVLDSGSTDNTAKVARELGCIVHEVGSMFKVVIDRATADAINSKYIIEGEGKVINPGDTLFNFAAARNYIADLASNDFISMPDCDEIYTKLDLDTINEKIESGIQQFEYQFVFSHDSQGNPLVQFLHSKFYNRKNLKWVGIIHEILTGDAKREYLPESIIKLEHYQNVETNRSHYLTGLALDCYRNPTNDRNAHYFARELMYRNRFRSAIKQFKVHVEMNKWTEERAQSMLHIGECYQYIGKFDETLKWYMKALDICPERREPLMKLAEYYFSKNSPKHVIVYAEAALTINGGSFYSNFQPYYTNLPHELLYWAYWWAGDRNKSRMHYDIAFSMKPNHPKYISDRQFYYPEEQIYQDKGIDGYMSLSELNWLHQKAKEVDTFLELGSWKGRSSHALLSANKSKIICVDTWQGSMDPGDATNSLAKKEDIFELFKKNTEGFNNLVINRKKGIEAAKDYEDKSIDCIFIDAGHTYEEVKEDIAAWLPKAKKMICGHDYVNVWPGVIKAVNEAFGKPDGVCDSIWYKSLNEIPKNIFTIWLGDEPTDAIKKCIESQKIPGYVHKLITLENCPKDIPYVNEAIASKKWVKAADYLRAYYLYNEGGIYLDADMEILPDRNFDDMLNYSLFACREDNGFIANSAFGCVKGNKILEEFLKEVPLKFKGNDDLAFESGMEMFSNLVYRDGENNLGNKIYSSDYFFPYNHQTGTINITKNTRVFHHFFKSWKNSSDILPTVSIILPTLGREDGLKRALKSIDRLYYPKHLIETIVIDGEGTVPEKVAKGLKMSKGNYIVYAANDIEFTEMSLYDIIKENRPFASFNTGKVSEDEGNICEHFIIHRDLVRLLDKEEIFSTEMNHVGVDNYLWAQLKKFGLAYRSEKSIMKHYHFSKGNAWDEVYEKGWSKIKEDRKVLEEKLKML
jgi:glycosyltransferase involved in cell wall biosynthesis